MLPCVSGARKVGRAGATFASLRSFHSSAQLEKARGRPRKNFYAPRERYWENLENMKKNGFDPQPTVSLVLKQIQMLNYPLGDVYMRNKPRLELPSDHFKNLYYKEYPRERSIFLHRSKPGDYEWYKLPVDRFLERVQAYMNEGMSEKDALTLAHKEKKWDEEAVKIEMDICKQQAEVLFGRQPTDWEAELGEPDPTELMLTYDPRVDEKLARDIQYDLCSHITNLVNQRLEDPRRRKIRLEDTKMLYMDLMHYLQRNAHFREHFDETVFFGGPVPSEMPKALPTSLRPGMKAPKEDEDVLLDDLNFQMSNWANEMLDYFYDKTSPGDMADLSPEKRHEAERMVYASKMQRAFDISENQSSIERSMASGFEADPLEMMRETFTSGADEVLNNLESGAVRPELQREIDTLFADLQQQRSSKK